MKSVVMPLALIGAACTVSVLGYWAVAQVTEEGPTSLLVRQAEAFGLRSAYTLEELEIAQSTIESIEERYVEPERIDYNGMLDSGLAAVERRVPTVMFRREQGGTMLHVQVRDHSTVIEVPSLDKGSQLHRKLVEIIGVVAKGVRPGDLGPAEDHEESMADIEYVLVNGILDTLDPHSRLLPPEDSKQMEVENKGEFGGLGITIEERKGVLVIEKALRDTPAFKMGLTSEDRIVRIDGESTINLGLEAAVTRLRGRVGSDVVVTIERDNVPEPFDVTITRAVIKLNPVEGYLLDGGVGIISIKAFHAGVSAGLSAELARLSREVPGGQLKGLILDLRGNPGGYLNQAVAVSDKFLEQGVIVSTRDANGAQDDLQNAKSPRTEPRYPMVVLVDASSASASEIVGGALRNNERAVIVGERTFGKGSVQNLTGLINNTKLKLTIAKYYTPGEKSIQSVGIPADLEILPARIKRADVESESDTALLFWRERVRRESSFEHHLERQFSEEERPVFSIRYLLPNDLGRHSVDQEYLSKDPQVSFARDVLLAANGRYRRPDVLAAAWSVVETYRKKGDSDIEGAFKAQGIDWKTGPSRDRVSLDVRLDLGEDGQLVAGEEEKVWLEVRNLGDETIHRLAAVSSSPAEILDGREFFFGALEPGETKRFAQDVSLTEGYATERSPVSFAFRDSGNDELYSWKAQLPVQRSALPRLAWSWALTDTKEGNGDGIAQVAETIDFELTVKNVGEGPTSEAFAKLRNKSMAAVDLVRASVEPGYMRDANGAVCERFEPAEQISSERPMLSKSEYAPGCERTLQPGESWTGTFSVRLNEAPAEGPFELELSIGDASAYDHTTVMRGGFYSTFTNTAMVRFALDEALSSGQPVEPPVVQISRRPDTVVDGRRVTISGTVSDESGLAHVLVFNGSDKVFLETGGDGELRSVPFSADLSLEPGLNTVHVIATDRDGLVRTDSIVVNYDSGEVQAAVDDAGPNGG